MSEATDKMREAKAAKQKAKDDTINGIVDVMSDLSKSVQAINARLDNIEKPVEKKIEQAVADTFQQKVIDSNKWPAAPEVQSIVHDINLYDL